MVDQSRLSMPKKELLDVVRSVYAGRRHVLPEVAARLAEHLGTNGTDTLITIRGEYPEARIIMLTTSDSDGDIQRAMRAGASRSMSGSDPTENRVVLHSQNTNWLARRHSQLSRLDKWQARCLARSSHGSKGRQ